MRKHERGVTALGWVFLLVPIALVVYAGIRVAPAYLNFTKVARAVEQTAADFRGEENPSVQAIQSGIGKRFDIESINFPKVEDIVISRGEGGLQIAAEYEEVAPLFANVSLLLKFERTATIN